jgi:hypothetical protein
MNSMKDSQSTEYKDDLSSLDELVDISMTGSANSNRGHNEELFTTPVEPSHDNGAIFGYLALPPMFFLTIQYVVHLVVFVHENIFNFFRIPRWGEGCTARRQA